MKTTHPIQDFLEIKWSDAPSFSPDGSMIAFLSNLSGTSQMYLVPRTGGEPEQLTFYEDAVSFVAFSPVKNEILFGMAVGGNERTQLYLFDIETKTVHPITNNSEVIYRFGGWSRDGKYISYASNERNGTDFNVFVMNTETKTSRCVFDKGGSCGSYGFSPSGNTLVVIDVHSSSDQDLHLVNLETGTNEQITIHEDNAEYGRPHWLPGDSGFFFTSNEGQDMTSLAFYDLQAKTRKIILTPLWEIDRITLTKDGIHLAVLTNENGYSHLTIYDSKTLQPIENQSFPEGMIEDIHWSHDGKYLAFSFESSITNCDVWIWSLEENTCQQITKSPRRVPGGVFVKPKLIHYTSFDGLSIPAFLYLPKNQMERVPVIVNIHGGPEAQSRLEFSALTQYFVHQGYGVIIPNVRGSSGYGKNYMALDDREKRFDSVKDLAALHGYLKTVAGIDPEKIVLMGGSYGGYMTLAGLTFFPELWAAGVDIVGMSNLVTFLENTSSYRRALREAEYGYLATDKDFLESISPLNFIENIKAPLMVIHGANDPRVPLSEAHQIHDKLKALGRTVELLVYEDEGHGLVKLKNRLDAYPKVAEFLDKILKK